MQAISTVVDLRLQLLKMIDKLDLEITKCYLNITEAIVLMNDSSNPMESSET